MKKISIILILALVITVMANAQQQATQADQTPSSASVLGITPNLRNGFQFSLRGGYDIAPKFSEKGLIGTNNPMAELKGGAMGGLSADYYWNWIGIGIDADYIRNKVESQEMQSSMNLNRLFFGAGPNFRYLAPTNNYSIEFNARAGLGSVKSSGDLKEYINLESGNAPSLKGQVRFTYFVSPWIGIHTGSYYMHHFLVKYSDEFQNPGSTGYLSSIGAFAGVTFRLSPLPAVPKPRVQQKAPEALSINGVVVVCESSTPIDGVNIIVTEKKNGQERRLLSDNKGEFSFTVTPASEITIYGKKANYFSQVVALGPKDFQRYRNVRLEICMERVDCDESVRLDNIHYDLDKYDIRPDARPELDRLVQFLRDNPEVRVELSSHTDSRATHEYNERLSQNRANAAKAYVVSKGIASDRIVSVGYGETRLLNRCADGVSCSEAEHQLNRRTEMKIICPQ